MNKQMMKVVMKFLMKKRKIYSFGQSKTLMELLKKKRKSKINYNKINWQNKNKKKMLKNNFKIYHSKNKKK